MRTKVRDTDLHFAIFVAVVIFLLGSVCIDIPNIDIPDIKDAQQVIHEATGVNG